MAYDRILRSMGRILRSMGRILRCMTSKVRAVLVTCISSIDYF